MIYAGFWKRFIAIAIDSLILMIPSLILSPITYRGGGILLWLAYKVVFEASPISATPGKALMGIAVFTESGARLTVWQAFGRFLGTIVSTIPLLLGYLIQPFTAKRQAFHDFIVGSVVVLRDPPDVNYFKVWWAEVQSIARGAGVNAGPRSAGDGTFTTTGSVSAAAEIESLFKLYQSGALTEAEYQDKKAKILARV